MKAIALAATLSVCLNAWAQPGASAPAPRVVQAAPEGPPQRGGEPKVQRNVDEDEAVRVEELRVRGLTRRVTVHSKLPGAPAYEIRSSGDGRDPGQDRRSEGRSQWQLFSF
jgi:hypothetical protein